MNFNVEGMMRPHLHLSTQLLGRHQAMNAAVAVGIVESLQKFSLHISEKAIKNGIAKTRWPGRLEIVKQNPFVVLDGAHNPGSCKVLVQAIKDIFPKKKIILILGVSHDKDRKGICRELNAIAAQVILTKADNPRAFDFKKVNTKILFPKKEVVISKNLKEGLHLAAKKAGPNDIILVTGSLFIVGEARKLCINPI